MKKLKFLGILLIGLLLLASPANATGYRMIMMAGGVSAAEGGNDSYTKLLMHMEGTDDAQVFTDSSIGNLVEVDPGTGFSDAFGVFDGTGDYLSLPNHSDWDLSTGNFTIEYWIYRFDSGTYQAVVDNGDLINSHGWGLWISETNVLQFFGNGADTTIAGSTALITHKWYHVAVVRSGTGENETKLYVDGVQDGQGTVGDLDENVGGFYIGQTIDWDEDYEFNGYVDEVRISNTARYTSGFTPSTENFTSDANTKLLLHMDLPNTDPQSFVDSGNTGHTVTDNGNVYQKARNLGIIGTSCAYFDGTGDYLTIANHADWDFGSGNFTVESWLYADTYSSNNGIWQHDDDSNYFPLSASAESGGIYTYVDDTAVFAGGPIAKTWIHYACVRNSNTVTIYIDGVARNTHDVTGISFDTTNEFLVGRYATGSGDLVFEGYMDEFRVTNGTAVYTANFNPPTTALTAITNTKLLLHFDGGEGSVTFDDDSTSDHTVTANGNAIQVIGHGADAAADVKTENTQKKFGTTSAYFDGTGDYIQTAETVDFDLYDASWTIDFWAYFSATTSGDRIVLLEESGGQTSGIYFAADNKIAVGLFGTSSITSDTAYSTGQWYHIAVVRDGTTTYIFKDGVDDGSSVYEPFSNAGARYLNLGGVSDNFGGQALEGYIDELRISKGIARWTANFTPPNAAYYE